MMPGLMYRKAISLKRTGSNLFGARIIKDLRPLKKSMIQKACFLYIMVWVAKNGVMTDSQGFANLMQQRDTAKRGLISRFTYSCLHFFHSVIFLPALCLIHFHPAQINSILIPFILMNLLLSTIVIQRFSFFGMVMCLLYTIVKVPDNSN